jgi:apolipoprotein N-acyltransferase
VAKKNIISIGCFILSAILLTIIQPPYCVSFLAWIALVPFVIGALTNNKIRPILLWSYIISLIYWLGNVYWLMQVTIPGWLTLCIYMAFYWPVLVLCLRFCCERKMPLWFSLPILIIGTEALQGVFFKGFGYLMLGHSQFRNIPIIQIADIFGAAGVSFLVAMVNGLVAEILLSHKDIRRRQGYDGQAKTRRTNIITGVFVTLFAVAATILYGHYRINETPQFTQAGPVIGVVQSNVPVEAAKECEPVETTFLNMLVDSRKCFLTARPQLIIWPETMIDAVLDESYLKLISQSEDAMIFHNALVRHANEGVYVLVGSFAGQAVVADDNIIKLKTSFNSAFLYEPNDIGSRQHYNKIQLVPFGEFLPFKDSLPFLQKLLMILTPYTYDYTLNAGTDYTIFKMPMQNKIYRFACSICFEDTQPRIVRGFVLDKNQNKQTDWLVNISNDGWFVKKSGDRIIPGGELSQHMAACVFRAVENRLSVIRCANTGISCLIDSTGKIKDGFIEGTLGKKAIQRTCQRGWFADAVVIDKRITFFTRQGQILEIGCVICLILAVVMSIYKLKGSGK